MRERLVGNMRMVFRWFGEGNDPIPLKYIQQIPGVEGVVWALHDLQAGEVWPLDKIQEVHKQITDAGFHGEVVESVNVHEDIKLGLPTRDQYIENYIQTIKNLATVGVKVICYNFMPVFDWVRTDLYKELEDGSTALYYDKQIIDAMDPNELVKMISHDHDFTMPGWEPERLQYLSNLFQQYEGVTEDDLWDHLQYFLEKIIPVSEEYDIKMAIHPDDPPWSVFGLPRLITSEGNIEHFLQLVDHPNNGLTLCSGSLGSNPSINIPRIIERFADRIHFVHIRNVRVYEDGSFIETSHRTKDGTVDVYAIVKAYHDQNFNGYVRPDHGRHIWDEECRPGYSLYDRALGIMYLWGIWDALERIE